MHLLIIISLAASAYTKSTTTRVLSDSKGIETTTSNSIGYASGSSFNFAGTDYEFAVRNILANFNYAPTLAEDPGSSNEIGSTSRPRTRLEEQVIWYHLQLMHIDQNFIRNWLTNNRNKLPPNFPFSLPSRNVSTSFGPDYRFGERSVESDRLECEECMRQFKCSGLSESHMRSGFVPLKFAKTNDVADFRLNQPNAEKQFVDCSIHFENVNPHGPYDIGSESTSTTTERDELKKK